MGITGPILSEGEGLPFFRIGKETALKHFRSGLIHLNDFRYAAAKNSFIEAISIEDDFRLARKYLSDTYYLGGEWQESLKELEILEKSDKANHIWKNRAEVLRLLIAGSVQKKGLTFYKHISGDDFRHFRFRNPVDALVDPDGNLYVLSFQTTNIVKFDANGFPIGNYKGGFGRTFEGPLYFTYHKGNIFVSDFKGDRIYVITKKGYFKKRFGGKGSGPGEFYGPSGIAISKKDQLYVADSGNNRIQKLNLDGKFIQDFGKTGKGKLFSPAGLTIAEDNSIYVADMANKRIVNFDEEGNYIQEFSHENMRKPRNVKVHDGRFFVSDEINGMMIFNSKIDKWTRISSFMDETGKYVKLLRPFSSAEDFTGALYAVDYARHRLDVFVPKNYLTSNLNLFIEKIDISNFPDVSLYVRVKNRNNQELTGIRRSSFRVIENENNYPIVNVANMAEYNNKIKVALVYENSKEMAEVNKGIDGFLGKFFRSFTIKDNVEVIRAGKDADRIYPFGHSILDLYAKIRKSKTENNYINLGKAVYEGLTDLVPELGPKAILLLVTGNNLPHAFNQYNFIKIIQYANAHSIPIIVLSNQDSGEMVNIYKDIANRTGGMFLKIPGSNKEANLYDYVKSKKDRRYIVSYYSKTSSSLKNRYIDLEVNVLYRDLMGRADGGYFVPDN
ncbi:MAG: 6-bladed beta-propeller [Leptospiraceae bacterium]|nr:6-bladed beta-propeller [Leptospiraceae bacterium]